jgi:hypothetical protein
MKRLLFVPLIFFLFNCSSEDQKKDDAPKKSEQSETEVIKDLWTSKAIALEDKGWGYQLFRGSHLEINQQNIPAINGLHYFDSQDQAEIAAEFALTKIEQGFFPPTVSPLELDSIGAINLDSLIQVTEEMMNAEQK